MNDATDTVVLQTREVPMTELGAVQDHAAALRRLVSWDDVGILIDDGPHAVVIVFLNRGCVVAAARFCLSDEDSVQALQVYQNESRTVTELRSWQGHTVTDQQVVDLTELTRIWKESAGQSSKLDEMKLRKLFSPTANSIRTKGRSNRVSAKTRHQVLFDAHGRCMFEGCGIDLTRDEVTGRRGNFATLAHNVAVSEQGPRGIRYLSHSLSDHPENILLLCETHHRLVDRVAKCDYPADRLTAMRKTYCNRANELLDGLPLSPIPAFCVAWPVHRQRIALPSSRQVAESLKTIDARLDRRLLTVTENPSTLRSLSGPHLWSAMATEVECTSESILLQAGEEEYRAALFAMGLMPALIALGAKLGNKCEITPMLRFRDSGLWYWPSAQPQGKFYEIDGLDRLSESEGEVSLILGLTATPRALQETADSLGISTVSVKSDEQCLGNGALSHPEDGALFRQRMQELLHRLSDMHGVQTVHVLPCASNAACVFFGQAFDSYHPELVIYDFVPQGGSLAPALTVRNCDNKCVVKCCSS